MTRVEKTGRRGFTAFGCDPTGTIGTRHFAGTADILAHCAQSVLPPTPHPTGPLYRYTTGSTLLDTRIAALPIFAPDISDKLAAVLAPWRTTPDPVPAPARARLQPFVLSENERERQHRYAVTILARELPALASMASNTGRNQAAFRLVCRVGRWAHHEIITTDRLTVDVMAACEANGLVHEDGRRAVLATIASGLTRSAHDALPALEARHG